MSTISDIINDPNLSDEEKVAKCENYLRSKDDVEEDYHEYANTLLNLLTQGYLYHPPRNIYEKTPVFQSLKKLLKDPFWSEKEIYDGFFALLDGNKEVVQSEIESFLLEISSYGSKIDCHYFVSAFLNVYKNAYEGFWKWFGDRIKAYSVSDDDIVELCFCLEFFYYSSEYDIIIEKLLSVLQNYPSIFITKELLGYVYFNEKMWRNSISYYEMIYHDKDCFLLEYIDIVASKLAWSYEKVKDYRKAKIYYEDAVQIYPESENYKNNLGLCYLKLKQYSDALAIFNQCIEQNSEYTYCYNNKVRTLIAMGEKNEAVMFARNNNEKGKVQKSILELAVNALRKDTDVKAYGEAEFDQSSYERTESKRSYINTKKLQFSSEKILEDELMHRFERHGTVFGLELQIYNQDGDYYGRQYPIKGGRIDILAVDAQGNFHVIELKKDEGYCDVLEQMQGYMRWIRENKAKHGQKVYGIICLNNPKEETVKQIQSQPDIRLFEYSIAYREIK